MAMPESRPRSVERLHETPNGSGCSFSEELRSQLWRRCQLLFLTGLAVSVLAGAANRFLPIEPSLIAAPAQFRWGYAAVGHGALFLAGMAVLYLAKTSRRFLGLIAWTTIALNLVLAVYDRVSMSAAGDPYFAVAFLLFLTAAFLPWPARYQIALAATAVLAFAGVELLLFATRPEVRAFWADRGDTVGLLNAVAWGTSGIAILGVASVIVSRTLYALCRTQLRVRRLGNYTIDRELKSGGMGQVFVAEHALLLRPTALKLVRPGQAADPAALARFEREVKLSATLSHPNTITIYDVGRTQDGSLYYAMEYLEGFDLEELVDRFGPLPPARVVHILQQVCGSLSEAHARRIVHRDIKPSNVFITRRGGLYDFVKVLDFGLAKDIAADAPSGLTKTGVIYGTPRYMAPETVNGNGQIDGRADIYCLGAVAYWMLSGQPPFHSNSSLELVIDHVKTKPRPPSTVTELPIPPALESIVMCCLEKAPDDRFQSSCELQTALAALALESAWDQERARGWWTLHGTLADQATDCGVLLDGGATVAGSEANDRATRGSRNDVNLTSAREPARSAGEALRSSPIL